MATHDNPRYVKALNEAIDQAWIAYSDAKNPTSTTYREGFADGLERAMRLLERSKAEANAR